MSFEMGKMGVCCGYGGTSNDLVKNNSESEWKTISERREDMYFCELHFNNNEKHCWKINGFVVDCLSEDIIFQKVLKIWS